MTTNTRSLEERLREVLNYNPDTGVFVWRGQRPGPRRDGSTAGYLRKDGYRHIKVDGQTYQAHRLAWFYVYGEWPQNELDHRDTCRDHNWIDNLRPATKVQNQANVHLRKNNTSGAPGVSFKSGSKKWVARIKDNGKERHLGYFETFELARDAYAEAAKTIHGEFARVA